MNGKKIYTTGIDTPDIFKEIETSNGKSKVYDYHKIAALGFPINVTISPRGTLGKTHNVKEFVLDKFIEKRSQTIWLWNTKVQLEDDLIKFTVANEDVDPIKWQNIIREDNLFKDKTIEGDRGLFVNMQSLSTFKRGSRDPKYHYLVYEEINQSLVRVAKAQDYLFQNAWHTLTNDKDHTKGLQQMFLLSNMDSIDIPLLVKWGILRIDHEHNFYYSENGVPLIYLHYYIPTEEDIKRIEERNQWDWRYHMAKRSGLEDFLYKNISVYDNISHIMNWDEVKDYEYKELRKVYCIEGEYLSLWFMWDPNDKHEYIAYFKFERTKPQLPERYFLTIRVQDLQDNIQISIHTQRALLQYVSDGYCWYDSIHTKALLNKIF